MMSKMVLCATALYLSVFALAQQSSPESLGHKRERIHSALPMNDSIGAHQDITSLVGMELLLGEGAGVGSLHPPTFEAEFGKRVCSSDAIVVAHVLTSTAHMSASKQSIYSDYELIVEQAVRSKSTKPVYAGESIVVTCPGGTLHLPTGAVTVKSGTFPALEYNTSYLFFFRYLPASESYQPLDALSTFAPGPSGWKPLRMSRIIVPQVEQMSRQAFLSWISDVACDK